MDLSYRIAPKYINKKITTRNGEFKALFRVVLLYFIIFFINFLLTTVRVCDRIVDANFVKLDG